MSEASEKYDIILPNEFRKKVYKTVQTIYV